jgi:RES domain
MSSLDSPMSYWQFAISIKHVARYSYDAATQQFLQAVLVSANSRCHQIPANNENVLWRAQVGYEFRNEGAPDIAVVPFPPPRMKPLLHSANEGRVNSKGIPCLYVATDKGTAIAEVRPWVGAQVSVAQFPICKALKLVACDNDNGHHPLLERPIGGAQMNLEEEENYRWREIGHAFSNPVDPSNIAVADYAPTQVLSEHLRAHGFDGVMYKSRLGPGHNVAIFDLNALEVGNCQLYSVDGVQYKVSEAGNPYFITPKKNHP